MKVEPVEEIPLPPEPMAGGDQSIAAPLDIVDLSSLHAIKTEPVEVSPSPWGIK